MARAFTLLLALLISAAPLIPTQRISATSSPSEDTIRPFIIGGTPTTARVAPWQVRLEITTADGGRSLCGGSLLNSTWVITAAHCLVDSSGRWVTSVDVIAGITSTSDTGQRSRGDTGYIHSSYSPLTFAHDIGLVLLDPPLALDGITTAPISLPVNLPTDWPPIGSTAQISGWGLTSQNPDIMPSQLQGASITVQAAPGGPCALSTFSTYDPEIMMCAGVASGPPDACAGDSGGPAAVTTNGTAYLAGVTSHGLSTCAQAGYPGVYTRVTAHTSWILEVLQSANGGQVPSDIAQGATPGSTETPVPVPTGALQRVEVIGGTSVVSQDVEARIATMTGAATGRMAGGSRYLTAIAVAQAIHPGGVGDVYLASGTQFADALSASTALSRSPSALLLTSPGELLGEVGDELLRLAPSRVFLIGGEAALSSTVAAQVEALLGLSPVRLAGIDRYDTAAAVSRHAVPVGGGVLYLATGASFADALSASVALTDLSASLLLTASGHLPDVVAEEILRLSPHTIRVIGGPAAISDAVVAQVAQLTGLTPTRIAGVDRSATVASMSTYIHPSGSTDVFIVSGNGFADALAAAQGVLSRRASLLLVGQDQIPAATEVELIRLTTMALRGDLSGR